MQIVKAAILGGFSSYLGYFDWAFGHNKGVLQIRQYILPWQACPKGFFGNPSALWMNSCSVKIK
jgi:hypothetical protein